MNKNLRIDSIQRRERVTLRVNGEEVEAYRGEMLIAALIAAGYHTLKRSPVLGKPRGGLCGMGGCYECLVTVDGLPNVRACMVEVEDGMEVLVDG
jgi:sarcosine oxidase subunit alpha